MSSINLKDFPEDLHREAKVAAAREGKTLKDWIIETIKVRLEAEKRSK